MNSVALPAAAPASAVNAEMELIRRAARGDAESFGELFRRHGVMTWRLAQAVAPDRESASVAVRDGFARALRTHRRARRQEGPGASFRTSVLASTYRSAIQTVQQRQAEAPTAPSGGRGTNGTLAMAAFRSLPERWRGALWLSGVESMEPARIAAILGVSTAVATQLVARGRRGLEGRFAQAHKAVPDRIGPVLRAAAIDMPANLADVARDGLASARREKVPMVARLDERATRSMWVAVGGLLGVGIIGLGLIPGGSTVRTTLSAAGNAPSTGAIPVSSTAGSVSSGPNDFTLTPGINGGSGLLGSSASTVTSYAGTGGSSSAITSGSGGLAGPTSGGTTTTGGTGGSGTGTTGGSGTGTTSGSGSGSGSGTTTPLVNLAPVATVTSSGSSASVNVLPTSSGGSAVSVTVGCSSGVGVTVGSTTLGCPSTTSGSGTTGGSTPTSTTVPSPTQTVTNTLQQTTTAITNTVSGITSSLTGGL